MRWLTAASAELRAVVSWLLIDALVVEGVVVVGAAGCVGAVMKRLSFLGGASVWLLPGFELGTLDHEIAAADHPAGWAFRE